MREDEKIITHDGTKLPLSPRRLPLQPKRLSFDQLKEELMRQLREENGVPDDNEINRNWLRGKCE